MGFLNINLSSRKFKNQREELFYEALGILLYLPLYNGN